jgi:lysophospholipase L1-like esterase
VLPKLIPDLAKQLGIDKSHIINMFEAFGGEQTDKNLNMTVSRESLSYTCDGMHPNDKGMSLITSTVDKALD